MMVRYGVHKWLCARVLTEVTDHSMLLRIASRRLSSSTSSGTTLKLLVVDGYGSSSREQFKQSSMPLASTLYCDMLHRQAPRNVHLDMDVIKPCVDGYVMPSTETLSTYDGFAFTGSSYSAYDEHSDVTTQISLMKLCLDSGLSGFGSCWAQQIATIALGGEVVLNPQGREVGVGRKITLTAEGRAHPMFQGKRTSFDSFQSHQDECTRLPEGATVLATNEHTRVQAYSINYKGVDSWFVQYHPEYELGYYAQLINSRKDRMISSGFFQTEKDFHSYVNDLLTLHEDRDRLDLKWKYGIDNDVLDPMVKETETRNWLKSLLLTGRGR